LKRSWPATCWTCAAVIVVAWTVVACVIGAWTRRVSPASMASIDVSASVAAWMTIADLVANERPGGRLSVWCEHRLRTAWLADG
jgi:hypothetical protein